MQKEEEKILAKVDFFSTLDFSLASKSHMSINFKLSHKKKLPSMLDKFKLPHLKIQ